MSNIATHIGGWARWILVAALLYAKCFVFDILIAQSTALEWELTDYCAYGAAAVLLAIPVMFTKRRWPVWAILILSDIWMMANIIYYRAYRLFITWHLLSLSGNMAGFWDSIIPYCTPSLLWLPALTIPACICYAWPSKRMHIAEIVSAIVIGICLSICGSYAYWRNIRVYIPDVPFSAQWVNPFRLPQALTSNISEKERESARYIRYRSILAYPMYMVGDVIRSASLRTKPDHLTESDNRELQKIIGPVQPANTPHGNLLIVLLESFESWLIDSRDAYGNLICPELVSYIEKNPVLYVRDIESQIRYGMSGDGQLIINTGLYPTKEDVACVAFGHNAYPNLAHFYPHSAIVNPCRNVWNQTVVAASYGYQRLVEPQTENRFEWNDSIVVDKIIETMDALSSPACVMGITVSGHIPFTSSPDDIAIADSVPELFRHYMQTAHFTDRQLGRLLAWADTAQIMRESTIAITGDHRIFHAWFNDEIREYGLRTHLPFGTGQAGCPLIIKSPGIEKQLFIDHGKQIDIYTTILNLIGQSSYFWKGMGHCLITDQSSAETEYYIRSGLSDKLIRMNYFEKFE